MTPWRLVNGVMMRTGNTRTNARRYAQLYILLPLALIVVSIILLVVFKR